MHKKIIYKYILPVVTFILVFSVFGRVLQFAPWIDDSKLLWAMRFDVKDARWYLNHPGLPLFFFITEAVAGDSYLFRQLCNLVGKSLSSLAVGFFVYRLTQSKKAGVYTTCLSAVCYLGLEAITAPIMNVTVFVSIPLFLGYSSILSIKSESKLRYIWVLFYFFIALILDPGRALVGYLFIPYIYILRYSLAFFLSQLLIFRRILFSLLLFVFPFAVAFFIYFVWPSQVMIGLRGVFLEPHIYFEKIDRVGNAAAAVGNIIVGYIRPMSQNYQNTGVYERLYAYTGSIMFLFAIVFTLIFLVKKHRVFGIFTFFLWMILLFYLPNWFSEPRAPMSGAHRYLYLSGLGLCAFVGYLLSIIRQRYALMLFVLFFCLNVYHAHRILHWQQQFRDMGLVSLLWNAVDSEVPEEKSKHILFFTGSDPWLNQTIELFGVNRFLLRRQRNSYEFSPIITLNYEAVKQFVCVENYSLHDVYSWNVNTHGNMHSTTKNTREMVFNYCIKQ